MKIVLAPNAFKDSLTATEACQCMAEGILTVLPTTTIVKKPVADGGDGLVEIVMNQLQGEKICCHVRDPLFRKITSDFCYLPAKKTAVIEMASASGLRLLSQKERNPLYTSTIGTGDLIKEALDLGATTILVGIGGSATNDGGCGMAAALGAAFFDQKGQPVQPLGGELERISRIDLSGLDPRLAAVNIQAICDVTNPLLGSEGASAVYAPQKGASPEEVEQLERGMAQLAKQIQSDLGKDVMSLQSGGAAGGLGVGLFAFLQAKIRPGIKVVLELVELGAELEDCDLVITGEGQIDAQTAFGKAPAGVAQLAKEHHCPCFAIAGSRGGDLSELFELGFSAIFSICPGPISLRQAMQEVKTYLRQETEQALRSFLAGKSRV